jgi:hypothetical protein
MREVRHEEQVEVRQVVGEVFAGQHQVGRQQAVGRRRDTRQVGQGPPYADGELETVPAARAAHDDVRRRGQRPNQEIVVGGAGVNARGRLERRRRVEARQIPPDVVAQQVGDPLLGGSGVRPDVDVDVRMVQTDLHPRRAQDREAVGVLLAVVNPDRETGRAEIVLAARAGRVIDHLLLGGLHGQRRPNPGQDLVDPRSGRHDRLAGPIAALARHDLDPAVDRP